MQATQTRAWIEMPASAGSDAVVPVLIDVEDYEALDGRSVSMPAAELEGCAS